MWENEEGKLSVRLLSALPLLSPSRTHFLCSREDIGFSFTTRNQDSGRRMEEVKESYWIIYIDSIETTCLFVKR
jgi:hypothetical protein